MSDQDELERLRTLAQQHAAGEPPDGPVADVTPIRQAPNLLPTDNDPELVKALGAAFRPVPFGYFVAPGEVGGQPCVYLTLETAIGRFALPFTREEAAELGKTLMRNATGLILPGT